MKVEDMNDSQIITVWECLTDYNPRDEVYGMPMDDWAHLIKSEMERRGLPKFKKVKVVFRDCEYVGIVYLDKPMNYLTTMHGTMIPGTEAVDFQWYLTEESNIESWLKRFKTNTGVNISLLEESNA